MLSKTNPPRLGLSLLLLLFSFIGRGQSLKGQVLDSKTGEPMSGATIELKGKNLSGDRKLFVKLDGNFVFRNLPAGEYEVEVSFANYKKYKEHFTISVPGNKEMKCILEPDILELSTVTILNGNGDRRTRVREAPGHAEPDAAIAAGDDRDAAGQIELTHFCVSP